MSGAWAGARATRDRAALASTLPAPCGRCGGMVESWMPWDVGHVVDVAAGGAVWDRRNQQVEHADCNRSAGATAGNLNRTPGGRRLRP